MNTVELEFEDSEEGSSTDEVVVLRPVGVGTGTRLRFLDPLDCNEFVELFHRCNKKSFFSNATRHAHDKPPWDDRHGKPPDAEIGFL